MHSTTQGNAWHQDARIEACGLNIVNHSHHTELQTSKGFVVCVLSQTPFLPCWFLETTATKQKKSCPQT
jgi:hypothetical protein